MCAKLGIDSHLHALRHYSATELLAAGMELPAVAGRLGNHPNTLVRVYAAAWLYSSDRKAADKDERLAAQEALLGAQRGLIEGQAKQLSNQDELLWMQSEQIDTQHALLAAQAELVKRLEIEIAEFQRRLGMSSSNSSVLPSKDSIAARAKRRADRSWWAGRP
jgi:hypothetical protein